MLYFSSFTLCSTPFSTIVQRDRKSTRLNSSHGYISYAVFCLKKTNEGICLLEFGYLQSCLLHASCMSPFCCEAADTLTYEFCDPHLSPHSSFRRDSSLSRYT